jgi:3-deoxy-D-manno-octulosonic-acid transferase
VEGFSLVLAQGEADAARLATLGARDVRAPGNLKGAAPPLPADAAALAALQAATTGRVVWAAASTHPGEEEIVLAAHRLAAARVPGLLTLVVPRHPERGAAVAGLARAAGLAATRRSLGEPPSAPVHVFDTLGELGLVYRAARAAFVGGSLVPRGGHNPVEAARIGCPVLMGPHVANVAGLAGPLAHVGALAAVADAPTLAAALLSWLTDDTARARAAAAALRAAAGFDGALAAVAAAVLPFVERLPRDHARP